MTDAGYVVGGYAVTVVAIGAYIGHMWARHRTLARATPPRPGHGDGVVADADTHDEAR